MSVINIERFIWTTHQAMPSSEEASSPPGTRVRPLLLHVGPFMWPAMAAAQHSRTPHGGRSGMPKTMISTKGTPIKTSPNLEKPKQRKTRLSKP